MTTTSAAIVAAIEQGRTIHANISKALRFLLATNFSEILVTLGAMAVGVPRPMSAIQFLWINLLSDVAPALALAVEPAEPDVMARPPRDPRGPDPVPRRPCSRSPATPASWPPRHSASTALARGAATARGRAPRRWPSPLHHARSCCTRSLSLEQSARRHRVSSPLFGPSWPPARRQLAAMAVPPLRGLLGLTPLTVGEWLWSAAPRSYRLVNEIRRHGTASVIAASPATRRDPWHRAKASARRP